MEEVKDVPSEEKTNFAPAILASPEDHRTK